MPRSMRRLSYLERTRINRESCEAQNRSEAAELFRTASLPTATVASIAGISTTTAHRIRTNIEIGDSDGLQKLLKPAENCPGAKPRITASQENMIAERLLFAARRGFAADKMDLKRLMAQTAVLNGRPFANGLPSDDTIRHFRAKHRELSFRNYEAKDQAKIKGERYEHVEPFFEIIESIGRYFPGLLIDGKRIWNVDETKVDAEYGKRTKVFCDAKSHHGGFRGHAAASGSGRHITAVIAASASGKLCPPFFIIEGKQVMSNWLLPLAQEEFQCLSTELKNKLTKPRWFPDDGAIYCTEKGSMDMYILPRFIEHVDRFKGNRVGGDVCEKKCEAVLAPANTSHFLQPCDQNINKSFQKEVRAVRDELCRCGIIDTKSIRIRLMCAVVAHSRITAMDCVTSFAKTGLFPFNRRFANRFTVPTVDLCLDSNKEQGDERNMQPETVTLQKAKRIIESPDDAARILQRLSILLQAHQTTNKIVMGLHQQDRRVGNVTQNVRNVALISGTAAEHLTIGEALERRRDRIAAKEREAATRELLRQQKEAEKQAALEQRRRDREAKEKEKLERAAARAAAAAAQAAALEEQRKAAEDKRRVAAEKRAQKKAQAAKRASSGQQKRAAAQRPDRVESSSAQSFFSSPTKSPLRKIVRRMND